MSQIRHLLIAIERALGHVGRPAIEFCQDRAAAAPLEAKMKVTRLADHAAPHLQRLVLVGCKLRS